MNTNAHETKHMDQVGQEAADLYWAHLGAAYKADQMKEMADDAEYLALKTSKGLGGIAVAEAQKANELKMINDTVLQPSVNDGAKHFRDNSDAFHRLAAIEDYDRSQATSIDVVASPAHTEHLDVRVEN
jgi:hypothetical protein